MSTTEKLREEAEITFFIGPLINGIQDFGVWKGMIKINSGVGPKIIKLQEHKV